MVPPLVALDGSFKVMVYEINRSWKVGSKQICVAYNLRVCSPQYAQINCVVSFDQGWQLDLSLEIGELERDIDVCLYGYT